ncbi:MAG TPA: hypothetical protein VD906_09505 [Caulobacteraceae bacterium]|nr:hypothetical protein [Caulobacteraceae bacterium]
MDFNKLVGICDDVSRRDARAAERKVYEAAGLNSDDSVDVARRKIQRLWVEGEGRRQRLTCEGGDFDVEHGSLLKYAVKAGELGFVYTAVAKWLVPLNQIDPSDGRTLLDYVDLEVTRNEGTDLGELLKQTYRPLLIEHGAKRAAELIKPLTDQRAD